jgi:hypothetical protein
MRALLLLLVAALGAPAAVAGHEPFVVLVDWTPVALVTPAPAGPGVDGASAATVAVVVPACQPRLLLDVLGAPGSTTLETERGAVQVYHLVDAWAQQDGTALGPATRIREPGYGFPLGEAAPGEALVRLVLRVGLLEQGEIRIRGASSFDATGCEGH